MFIGSGAMACIWKYSSQLKKNCKKFQWKFLFVTFYAPYKTLLGKQAMMCKNLCMNEKKTMKLHLCKTVILPKRWFAQKETPLYIENTLLSDLVVLRFRRHRMHA